MVHSSSIRLCDNPTHILTGGVEGPHALDPAATKAELGSVMQHQHRTVRGGNTLLCGLPMTFQDALLGDALMGEKAIRSFGVSPVLAGQGMLSPRPDENCCNNCCKR